MPLKFALSEKHSSVYVEMKIRNIFENISGMHEATESRHFKVLY